MSETKLPFEQLKLYLAQGLTVKEIATKHNMHPRSVKRRKAQLARQGYSPEHDMTKEAPEGYVVKGVSTLYDKDGNQSIQWVKTNIDAQKQLELLKEAVSALTDDITPAPPAEYNGHGDDNLLNQYTITDFHLGMMAWHEETGSDWDLNIAESLLIRWFQYAINHSPDARTGIFCQLGDFLHWDGLDAVTPMNKHILDADTRFQKLVRSAIHVSRAIVSMLLEKHETVILIQPGGNHDPASTIWLRELFYAYYANEPRVIVDNSADVYNCYEHGLTSLFYHHGHKKRMAAIDEVFVAKFREIFGRTKFAYAHMGHLHHDRTLESALMTVKQHRTLAAPDAYAASHGFMSGREATVSTYHKQFGLVGEQVISPDMVNFYTNQGAK